MFIFLEKGIFLALLVWVTSFPSAAFERFMYIHVEKSEEDMLSFGNALKIDTTCEELIFGRWTLNDRNIGILFDALKVNGHITSLSIHYNHLRGKAEKIADIFRCNNVIKNIDLGETYITPDEVFALAEAIEINSSLEGLTLRDNTVGGHVKFMKIVDNKWVPEDKKPGIARLAEALKRNESLKRLDLSKCLLNEKDAQVLAAALKENKNLTSLNVSENLLREAGIKSILNALQDNKSLIYITIDIDYKEENIDAISSAIHDLLRINTGITLLIGVMNLFGREEQEKGALKKLLGTIDTKYSVRVKSTAGYIW